MANRGSHILPLYYDCFLSQNAALYTHLTPSLPPRPHPDVATGASM